MPQEKHTPFPVPYVSFPITLFGHRKFIALTQHPWKGTPEFVFRLLAHAAAHFPDGDFSPIAPTGEKGEEVGGKRAVWNTIFRVSYGNRSFDKKHPDATDWGWQIALHFRESGWFDEQWVLDPELFQNWNQKLARDSGQRSAQARFNAMKRHHPEQLDSLADAFFSDFGRWPVGYEPPPPSEPSAGGEATGQRPPLEPDTGPPPGESENRPSVAPEGRSGSRSETHSKAALRGANTGKKPDSVKPVPHGVKTPLETPSKRLWAAGKALALVPKGSTRAKALEKVMAEASAELTGVSLDLPAPKPTTAPPKPAAAPSGKQLTPLDSALIFLETPDFLTAQQVAVLRKAGIALPAEVAARFPISSPSPMRSPTAQTRGSGKGGVVAERPAAKPRQGTFLRSKAFKPAAAPVGQLKLPIRPARKPANKQLAPA
jgi:hypothetical protein